MKKRIAVRRILWTSPDTSLNCSPRGSPGPLAYSVREFADTLCLSGTLVDREVNTLTALGLLDRTGQTLFSDPRRDWKRWNPTG